MIDLRTVTRSMLALAAAIAFLAVSIPISYADGGPSANVLFDSGNGNTEWFVASEGATYRDVFRGTARSNDIPYDDAEGITVYGIGETTVGGPDTGGNLFNSGTSGILSTSLWTAYRWNSSGNAWEQISNLDDAYGSEYLSLAYYPAGCAPAETPDQRGSWTMFRGNSSQEGHQKNVTVRDGYAGVDWEVGRSGTSGLYAGLLNVGEYIFAKFGASKNLDPAVICYRLDRSNDPAEMKVWEFTYEGLENYETATPIIVGPHIYVQTTNGFIHRFPWMTGPGVGNADVVTSNKIPETTGATVIGAEFGPGIGSMVYDTGSMYFLANNGMAYCFDLDLQLVWSRQMGGHNYYVSPTISGDFLFTGAKDGHLYVMDKKTGDVLDSKEVFSIAMSGNVYGNVSAPAVFKNEDIHTVVFTVTDGRGMSSVVGGLAIYEFDSSSSKLTKKYLNTQDFGLVSNYVLPLETADFKGVVVVCSKGVFSLDVEGNRRLLNDALYPIKAPPILVNGESIFLSSYESWRPLYEIDLEGNILSLWVPDVKARNHSMSPLLFVGETLLFASDSSLSGISGSFPVYVPPAPDESMPLWMMLLAILLSLIALLALVYALLRFRKGIEKPFTHIRQRMSYYVKSDEFGHNIRSKHRLFIAIVAGAVLTIVLFITCLCVGPTATLSVPEMFSSLASAVSKDGQRLTYNELIVFESRLPRTLVAFGVGVGLSIAGSVYQAIIRNPLVDPYIMGVSAGAGTAAVAVIAFDFTFFGLFAPHSIYITAFTAIIGGMAAFLATMFIAEKAGGSSLNYVLAGVIIGLAFSAVQTLMLSLAGHNVSNALSWLFGSFANITWTQVWLVLAPALTLSMVPLIWAKELNLVLLGEDQAQQMGLDVRNFNRLMLILASVLTSICVAFVGIIGFVGLVIPHLCRMLLGGDHRLVLPASIVFGGALMMAADLVARMAYAGLELPVGAITTVIGVPVFAYLLIKRGKMYDG